MFAKQLASAIEAARPSQLDHLARTLWKAHAQALLTAEDAQDLAEAIEARRALGKAQQTARKPAPRRVGSRPRSAASLERRRRWVSAGLLPPSVACRFTMGEAAVLGVVGAECARRGRCEMTVGAIAATAGVCATTVRNALREAKQLGLLAIKERRLSWTRNLPNVVMIVAPEWRSWLRLGPKGGGCKFARPTPTKVLNKPFAPFEQYRRKKGSVASGRPLRAILPQSGVPQPKGMERSPRPFVAK